MHLLRLRTRPIVLSLILAGTGCEGSSPLPVPPEEPAGLSVQYVCGNGFDLQSRDSSAVTVHYEVMGTAEEGDLVLSPRVDAATPSTTRLVTLRAGSVRVGAGGGWLEPVSNLGAECPPLSLPRPQLEQGEWSEPFPWPVVAVHLHLLPDGNVLSWGAVGEPQIWDPTTRTFSGVPSDTDLFCSGHAFLPDGRLLVTGGHISLDHGLPDVNIFDPASRTWTSMAPMSRGRWYPTSTTLPNGEVLTLAGRDENSAEVELPEVWTGSRWRSLPGAGRVLPYYPRAFVAPNGLVFYAGELQETAYLDPSGAGQWTPVASSHYGRRDYGSAVMYRPGEVMILGGSDPPDGAPTNTAELIDLNDPSPAWRFTASMTHQRRQFNATLLPDGRVLATGGTSAAGFTDPSGAVRAAEMWDPATGAWTQLASNRVTRVYHSSALLLPDGRILLAGSGDGAGLPRELNAEIYSPPYLFRGPRPVISGTPGVLGYGGSFFIETPDAGRVVGASLVRLGSVTHGFDQNQRFLPLSIRRVANGLLLGGPATKNLAPPGDYLLFILNDSGVPSLGWTVRMQ